MTITEAIVRRDRAIILAGLAVIVVLAWVFVLGGAGTGMNVRAMTTWAFPPPMDRPQMIGDWNAAYWLIMFIMWWIMMIAMMVPSAAPVILLYARVYRHGQKKGQIGNPTIPTAFFGMGYVVAWGAFSLIATIAQFTLEITGLVHGMMMWSLSPVLTILFLFAAGIYQLSPLKDVCLSHCRSPADFLSRHWHKGSSGAFKMGMHHGLYCVGCCWFLMGLLFVGGIMNVIWIAGLAILVLVEKIAPNGRAVSAASGTILLTAAAYVTLIVAF